MDQLFFLGESEGFRYLGCVSRNVLIRGRSRLLRPSFRRNVVPGFGKQLIPITRIEQVSLLCLASVRSGVQEHARQQNE